MLEKWAEFGKKPNEKLNGTNPKIDRRWFKLTKMVVTKQGKLRNEENWCRYQNEIKALLLYCPNILLFGWVLFVCKSVHWKGEKMVKKICLNLRGVPQILRLFSHRQTDFLPTYFKTRFYFDLWTKSWAKLQQMCYRALKSPFFLRRKCIRDNLAHTADNLGIFRWS